MVANPDERFHKGMNVLMAVRPEHSEVHPEDYISKRENVMSGMVSGIEYLGDLSRYNVMTDYQMINADQYSPSLEKAFKFDEKVILDFNRENVHLIDVL